MNLPEKSSTHFDIQSTPIPQVKPKTKWTSGILRLVVMLAITAAILCAPIGPQVLAKSGHQADAKAASAIDPDAMDALNKMGVYLRTLKSFQVIANVSTDDVLDDGQTIQFNSKVDLVSVRPDRLRVEITDDAGHRFFYYDGKSFTIYGEVVNFYATVPAPPTIAQLADDLSEKYDIELPLVDLFAWGAPGSEEAKRITAADDIGPSAVDGVTCEQYAFRQPGVDWQIWIQLGENPLPRKVVIRTLTDDAKPQHSETLAWNLAPSYSDNAFTFDPPPNAKRITLAEIKAQTTEKK